VSSLSATSLALVSDAITKIAATDIASKEARTALYNMTLALYIEAPAPLQIIVKVDADKVSIRELTEHDRPTQYLVGNPIEIFRALQGQPHDAALTGDLSLWQDYLSQLNVNWPVILEPIIGADAAAVFGKQLNNATELRASAAAELSRMATTFRARERGHYNPMPTVSAAVNAVTDLFKRR